MLGLGWFQAVPPLTESCWVPAAVPTVGSLSRVARPLVSGHQAGQEEEGRAWLHGGWGSWDGKPGGRAQACPKDLW